MDFKTIITSNLLMVFLPNPIWKKCHWYFWQLVDFQSFLIDFDFRQSDFESFFGWSDFQQSNPLLTKRLNCCFGVVIGFLPKWLNGIFDYMSFYFLTPMSLKVIFFIEVILGFFRVRKFGLLTPSQRFF